MRVGRGSPCFVIRSLYSELRSCSSLGGSLACFVPAIVMRLPIFCERAFISGAAVAAAFQLRAASLYFFCDARLTARLFRTLALPGSRLRHFSKCCWAFLSLFWTVP